MPVPSPTPSRVRTPRWLDVRLLAGIGLVLVAVLIGATVVSVAQRTQRVIAVAHDLAAGSVLRSTDLTSVRVHLPDRARYAARIEQAVGHRLNRPLGAGELVPTSALDVRPAQTTLSVPFAAGTAPQLTAGQRIEVWLSTPACPSVVLLGDVTVQQVRAGSDGLGAAGQDVVISVSAPLAERVVAALAGKDVAIRAGVLSGSAHDDANDDLPALDVCLPAPS